jgi:hypothetical protein
LASNDFTLNAPVVEIDDTTNRSLFELDISGNRRAAGLLISSNSSAVQRSHIYLFKNYGVHVLGGVKMSGCFIEQWPGNVEEALIESNYTADGLRVEASDVDVFNTNIRYCGCCYRQKENGYTVNVLACHFWNGGGSLDIVRTRPKLIIVEEGAGTVDFVNCYLDNGEIDLYNHRVHFVGCKGLVNPVAATLDHFIAIYARETNHVESFLSTNWTIYSSALRDGSVPFLQFLDNGAFEWGTDYSKVNGRSASYLDHVTNGQYTILSCGNNDDALGFEFLAPRATCRLLLRNNNDDDENISQVYSGDTTLYVRAAEQFVIKIADTWAVVLDSNRNFYPQHDGVSKLGKPGFKWDTVYAATGTINTSDERSKQDIQELTETERAVATELKGMIRTFRFKSAVAKKEENARIHVGVVAQQVKAVFEAHGLDPARYALFCYDEWPESKNPETDVVTPAGNAYGIRYEELLAFIISAL